MKIPTKLTQAIALALGVTALGAQAATPNPGDILTITDGVTIFDSYGNPAGVSSGSWFGMDTDANSKIAAPEATAINGLNGITIGSTQTAGDIDTWVFFGPTGNHYTTVAPTGNTTDGLDFSGWTVSWGAVPTIPMGAGAWTPGNCGAAHMGCTGLTFTNGVANFSWSGVYGDSYSLWYTATVPDGDASGFGNVQYIVRLVGTVLSGNAAPVATDFTVATPVDTSLPIDLTTRVTDSDGTISWTTLAVSCDSGSATDDDAGTVTFTPTGGTEGTTASCTYTVDDNDGATSNQGTISINITAVGAVNTPPTATGTTLDVTVGGSVNWTPDVTDADSDTLSCVIASAPTYGTVTFTAGCASATYTHNGSVSTNDSFTFTATDGTDTSAAATVNVTISAAPNAAPTAVDFAATAIGTTPTSIGFTGQVTDADGTIDWATLSVSCDSGTTTHNSAGTATYTAPANFVGAVPCTYSVRDDDGDPSNTATLTVNVVAPVTGGVLPNGVVVLQLDGGMQELTPDGDKADVSAGSWFGMDMDGNSRMAGSEKTPLQPGPDGGLMIGAAQASTGSHSGAPNGSENASVDAPWAFFGNTGMHFTTVAPSAIGGNTANGIDMSGWRVTWNAIPAINMGAGAWAPGNCAALDITICSFTNGAGQFTYTDVDGSGNISDGDTYRLIYAATVPEGDPSGFGRVRYLLNLEGTVSVIPAPTSTGGLQDGDFGGSATNGYRATTALPADPDYSNVGGYFDYKIACAGTCDTFITLTAPIPANAVLRKYGVTPGNPAGGWDIFDGTGGDSLSSATRASGGGDCAAASYTSGLTAGHDCLRITQADGGLNDSDAVVGIIGDPSGIAVPAAVAVAPDLSSGSSGCTLAARPASAAKAGDWLLVGLALAGLAFLRRRVA